MQQTLRHIAGTNINKGHFSDKFYLLKTIKSAFKNIIKINHSNLILTSNSHLR
jgi:hypothetical protein